MTLRRSIENGFATLVTAAVGATAEVFTGYEDETQTHPCVVCVANSATEEPQESGNFFIEISVSVKGQIDDDPNLDNHETLLSLVNNALLVDDLAAQLSVASGASVFHPVIDDGQSSAAQGRSIVSVQKFKVYGCSAGVI